MSGAIPQLSQFAFMAWYTVNKEHRGLMCQWMMTDMVLETSVQYKYLTRLTAREDFIAAKAQERITLFYFTLLYFYIAIFTR
jgi:hypothetical protein